MLNINNLSKSFNNKVVLNAINLHIAQGSIAFLLGSSGVGKSTLLRVLNSLERADQGTVSLNAKNIDVTNGIHNPAVGMVFQHCNLFNNLTIERNITLALQIIKNISEVESKKQAAQLLQNYNLIDKAQCYPAQLSGGQKQRVALARTLALDPSLICLDEPTSALDPSLTSQVAQTITQLAADNYIVIVASHDVSLLYLLDCTIYLMAQGSIIQTMHSKALREQSNHHSAIHQFIQGSI